MASTPLDDRVALVDLVAAYARECDQCHPDEIAALFTDDGGFTVIRPDAEPTEVRGRDRLVSAFAGLSRYEHTFHHVGQQTVELDGDRATGDTYCIAHHVEAAADGSRSVMAMHIRYQDRYARTAGGWRFEFRTLLVDWTETRPLASPV